MKRLLKLSKMAVNYHNRYGGVCPVCHVAKAKIVHAVPWLDETKIRYHKCICGFNFTSIEDEQPAPAKVIEPPKKEPRKRKRKSKNRKKK